MMKTRNYPIFMRYPMLNPRFTCLAEECMLNTIIKINMTRWKHKLSKAKDIYKKINIFSNADSNKNYGIEKYSPIAIQHIISIKIYTESTKYAHELSRSYWELRDLEPQSNEKIIQHLHCNNFYIGYKQEYKQDIQNKLGLNTHDDHLVHNDHYHDFSAHIKCLCFLDNLFVIIIRFVCA